VEEAGETQGGKGGKGRKRGKQSQGQAGEPKPKRPKGRTPLKPVEDLPNPPVPELPEVQGKYLALYLDSVQLEAQARGIKWTPPVDNKIPRWPRRYEARFQGVRDPRLTVVNQDHFSLKEAYWPFCTLFSRDPFSRTALMPRGWEKWLCEHAPPYLPLELEYTAQNRGTGPHYRKARAAQKVAVVWKYLFDCYPYLLPPEISRVPYPTDLPASFQPPYAAIPLPWK
jgi:hypothetical protein